MTILHSIVLEVIYTHTFTFKDTVALQVDYLKKISFWIRKIIIREVTMLLTKILTFSIQFTKLHI